MMNGVDIYSVKISVTNEQEKKRAYRVFIDKSGYVIMVKNEFGTINPGTVDIGIKNVHEIIFHARFHVSYEVNFM